MSEARKGGGVENGAPICRHLRFKLVNTSRGERLSQDLCWAKRFADFKRAPNQVPLAASGTDSLLPLCQELK